MGVSNVGPITRGGWAGRVCIGSSLALGPAGVLARAPQGVDAEALVVVEVPNLAPARTSQSTCR